MKTRGLTRRTLCLLLIACAVVPLLLSACQPVNASTSLPPAQPTEEKTADPATQPPANPSGGISLDLSGVAQSQTVETVAAVPAGPDKGWTMVMPEYRLLTLQGYPVTGSSMKPQIFIYPAGELAAYNEAAGGMLADLQAQLQSRQQVQSMPFLPLINAKQVMHPQVQYMDFKSGTGVRFLTWYSQGLAWVNNAELLYTYQGLTSDGKYYIAAVLPVTQLDLPATSKTYAMTEAEMKGYPEYLTKTADWLGQQPSGSFTPDLAKLDALIQSIDVK